MLNTLSKFPDRRSIMTQEVMHQVAIIQAPDKHISEPDDEHFCPAHKITVVPLQNAIIFDTRTKQCVGHHLIEPEAMFLRLQSTNNVPKPTEFLKNWQTIEKSAEKLSPHTRFHQDWRHRAKIGEGGDGVVHLYKQAKPRGMFIAVKVPQGYSARKDLEREISNMRIIGEHNHILELSYAIQDWYPYGPAMFLPYCELGSLTTYRRSWCEQQEWEEQPVRVSEITMYKLFRDMVLALEYLHNELGTRYVHNDFKPANILVVAPAEPLGAYTLPEEPVFKLADFARLTPWPTPQGQRPKGYDGTPEYAPPQYEQIAPVHPSADIWGLGATLQYMALGIQPIQSRESFVRSRKVKGSNYPGLKDENKWSSEYWRARIPTVFRPIHVSLRALQKDYDVAFDLPNYQPYGARLGYWYAQLWNPVSTRPKAATLAARAIPHFDYVVGRLKASRVKELRQDDPHGV